MKLRVELFITDFCPRCGSARDVLAATIETLGKKDSFEVRTVNVVEEIDHAVAVGVRATPAIAIDGTLVWTGGIDGNLKTTLIDSLNSQH